VPTTAGTGAEVTRNAVLTVPEQRVKVSLRSPLMLPDVAIVDPELTYSMPPGVTAVTGLDALTQVIEPFVSHLANPLTDALCREGIQRAGHSLRRAYGNGRDADARRDMALASLMGGLALANAKLGAVHGFAGSIGGMFAAPHGAVCARLLPYTMVANVQALQSRQPENPALPRYAEIARILTGDSSATVQDGVQWIQSLCADLQIPGLAAYGLTTDDLPTIVNKSKNASSMKGNPIQLSEAELTHILEQAL
jgi:alcohol dehydrogenase class IV